MPFMLQRTEFVSFEPGIVGVAEGRQVYVATRNLLEIFRRIHSKK